MTCEKDVGMGLCTFNFVSIPTPYLLALWHFIPTSLKKIFFIDLCILEQESFDFKSLFTYNYILRFLGEKTGIGKQGSIYCGGGAGEIPT